MSRSTPELLERGRRLQEAAAEGSLSGHLRRAIHRSGRPLRKIAADASLDVIVLCDFLQGTRTLRSDVLDRLAQAVGAVIQSSRPDRKPRKHRRREAAEPSGRRDCSGVAAVVLQADLPETRCPQ